MGLLLLLVFGGLSPLDPAETHGLEELWAGCQARVDFDRAEVEREMDGLRNLGEPGFPLCVSWWYLAP